MVVPITPAAPPMAVPTADEPVPTPAPASVPSLEATDVLAAAEPVAQSEGVALLAARPGLFSASKLNKHQCCCGHP